MVQLHAEGLADAGHQREAVERVATELEVVVVARHLPQPEHLAEQLGDPLLHGPARGLTLVLALGGLEGQGREGLVVHLAGGVRGRAACGTAREGTMYEGSDSASALSSEASLTPGAAGTTQATR